MARKETEAAAPDFWQDPVQAQATLRWIAQENRSVDTWRALHREAGELAGLLQLALEEGDTSLAPDLEAGIQKLSSRLASLEFRLLLQGEYDSRNAIVSFSAGAGGTEAQDWAQMLLRMYLRWAERAGYRAEVLETSPGEEAGIKSALVEIIGDYAYGYLRAEHGVHRLVRLSPFDADHARHTSFALVEVLPEAEKDVDIKVNPGEVRIDV
ncbi:MAG: PCRF domain-containing protein, partial [Chloroflexota bacterium]